jgi:hypothetical protein
MDTPSVAAPQRGDRMLNLNQKRALGITLWYLEEELIRLREILAAGGKETIFSHMLDDLSPEIKDCLNEKIDLLMAQMLDLKSAFDLHHSQKELVISALVKTTAIYLSVQLDGVVSGKLRGYGEIHPALAESLNPRINEMIQLLQQMHTIAGGES